EVDVQVLRRGREHVAVRAGGGHLEGDGGLAARLDLDDLTRLHTEGGTVDDLAVDEDVTVGHGLPGLRDRAAEAGAEHESVETHLEQLDQGLTGQVRLTAGLVEGAAELDLAEPVLGAQTLLLLESDRVVGLVAAAGTTVLT